jgi:4-hydroxybenzoate polyprenyltransferase
LNNDHRATNPTQASALRETVRALRPQQWAKNVFIFVPVLTANRWADADCVIDASLAFVTLSLVASGTYVLNDLFDIEADRVHPAKRHRPLAAGTLSPRFGVMIALTLIGIGLGVSALLANTASTLMLAAYLAISVLYSVALKKLMILDVITLAGLYTHRILIGGVATEISISPWLLAFSLFLFMSLALVKRYLELDAARDSQTQRLARRAYTTDDTETLFSMGLVCGYLSILVLCLYVSSDDVSRLYSNPERLWVICPIMLYWVSRIWLLARRRDLDDDPVAFTITDGPSYLCVALLVAVVAVAL